MKQISYLIIAAVWTWVGCKKTTLTPTATASINVTNVVVGGTALTYNSTTLTVANNNYTQLTMNAGQSLVKLYPAATPNSPYFNQTIATSIGDYYSLFLTGTSPSTIDTVLIKESFQNYTDSVCGIRFINLSPGSSPISVNLTGSPNGSEVGSLAYKAYSNFKQYAATKAVTSIGFQIRDATSGNLLATYSFSKTLTPLIPYFNNVTLVLKGLSTAPSILLVKDY